MFLYASNLVDIYRFQGEKNLIQAIEKKLTNEKYWLNRLQNRDVRFGYYENCNNLLICVKEKKKLYVYTVTKVGYELDDTISVLTGLDGDKKEEGDLKTPVGVYTLRNIINNVEQFYGPFAFVTSYPNMYDRLNNKDGHGIWIHGLPLEGKRDNNNTKGCIVMKNDKLEKLKDEINYKKTYLLISEHNIFAASKKDIASVLAFLYKWRKAWRECDFETYKSFYAENFKKSDGKGLKQFLDYKKRVFESKKHQKIKIFFTNINIIPYQNIENNKIFRIDMYEKYISPTYKYFGNKSLYVEFINNKIKIIAEK